MSEPGSRLSRWSRLKNEARQQSRVRFALPDELETTPAVETIDAAGTESDELDVEEAVAIQEDTLNQGAAELQQQVEGEVDADLPDIESLDASSDYTGFMSSKVSDTVRNMALRKLWRSDSVFANLDGLIDYGEDFTDAATVVEGMKSVYTVGRGMVDYEAEEAAKRAAEDAEVGDEVVAATDDQGTEPEGDDMDGESRTEQDQDNADDEKTVMASDNGLDDEAAITDGKETKNLDGNVGAMRAEGTLPT